MGHDQREVAAGEAVALQQMASYFCHAAHGIFEHLLAFLVHVMHFLVHRLMRGWVERASAGHVEITAARAIYIVMEVEDPLGVRSSRFDQHRAGAIAEQHAGGAVLIVDNRGHDVATDHQRILVRAGADKLRANSERVNKSRTGGREIKPPGFLRANAVLH